MPGVDRVCRVSVKWEERGTRGRGQNFVDDRGTAKLGDSRATFSFERASGAGGLVFHLPPSPRLRPGQIPHKTCQDAPFPPRRSINHIHSSEIPASEIRRSSSLDCLSRRTDHDGLLACERRGTPRVHRELYHARPRVEGRERFLVARRDGDKPPPLLQVSRTAQRPLPAHCPDRPIDGEHGAAPLDELSRVRRQSLARSAEMDLRLGRHGPKLDPPDL